jgi:hypothetical protein
MLSGDIIIINEWQVLSFKKTEAGRRKLEDWSWKTEDGRQKSGVGSRKTEDRRWKKNI